jgi:hypothetical protein
MNFNYAPHVYTWTLNIWTRIWKILIDKLTIFFHYLTIIFIFNKFIIIILLNINFYIMYIKRCRHAKKSKLIFFSFFC